MQVTVKDNYLNMRTGLPSVNAPNTQYLSPGQVFEIDGKLYKGDLYDGIDNWVKDLAGNYYWGGGISQPDSSFSEVVVNPPANYNSLIQNLPDTWRGTGGSGITIAILDTGCFNHDSLTGAFTAQYNAIDKSNDVNDISDLSHGTFIAGLIAGRPGLNITGIAPDANLIIVKVSDNDVGIDSTNVLEGLRWLSELVTKPDVINISLSFDPFPNESDFQRYFEQLSKTSLILAAAQNDANLITTNIFYPATETNVTAVGALDLGNDMLKNGNYRNINQSVKFIVQNASYYSTNKLNNYNNDNGCSFSTAVTAGIASLAKSYQNSQGNTTNLLNYLDQNTPSLTPDLFNTDIKLFKNP